MATTVYTVETVELQDGSKVTLRPMNIKGLRKFMKRMDEFGKSATNDEGMDILLDCAAICLMKERPEFWDKSKERGERDGEALEEGGYSEEAEEALDLPTVYRILDICGGVKLDDPNLIAAAMESLGQT